MWTLRIKRNPVINKNTQEKKELTISLKAYEAWRKDNPDWDKDWSEGTGGVTYGTPRMEDGFKEVMSKVQENHPTANLSRFT